MTNFQYIKICKIRLSRHQPYNFRLNLSILTLKYMPEFLVFFDKRQKIYQLKTSGFPGRFYYV